MRIRAEITEAYRSAEFSADRRIRSVHAAFHGKLRLRMIVTRFISKILPQSNRRQGNDIDRGGFDRYADGNVFAVRRIKIAAERTQ